MRGRRQRAGLTLVESLVALAVLAIAMAGVIPIFASNARINSRMELRTGSVVAAQTVLDDLRRQWVGWPASSTVTVGSRDYSVAISVCAEGSSDCMTRTDSRHVRLEVSHSGTTYYEVETVFTRFD